MIFELFKFSIKKKSDAPKNISIENRYNNNEEVLASFFNTGNVVPHKVPVYKGKSKAGDDIFNGEVVLKSDDIILYTLENNKTKQTVVDKQLQDHEHHPFCPVIIDYRPNHCIVAVPRHAAFDNKPSNIINILHYAYNEMLSRYYLELEFKNLIRPKAEFMSIINSIRTTFKDRVKYIKLEFSGEDKKPEKSDLIAHLFSLVQKGNGNGAFEIKERGDNGVDVDAIQNDLSIIAQICEEYGSYSLAVAFFKFGIYRYGADLRASFGLEEEILNSFKLEFKDNLMINGYHYELPAWFDRVINFMTDYEEEKFVEHRRNARRGR